MDEEAPLDPIEGPSDAEAAFARLQELYDRLPVMEESGRRLARARAAAEVLRCAGELATARVLLDEAEEREAEARAAFDRAAADGACDEAVVDELRRALLHAGSLRGFRVGPAQNAETALSRALDAGSFADVDEARAAALDERERGALAAEVESYRRDYAQTLARCEALASKDRA